MLVSMFSITDSMVSTQSGISACTMPTMTPVKLKIILIGASVTPRARSHWLTAPLRPSSTIQAKVRTRKLVQNGISTQMIRVLRVEVFTVESR